MELFEAIANRSSIRKYKAQMPSNEELMKVVEAARLAPSACNKQPWHFYLVKDSATRAKLTQAYDREWVKTAPVMLVATGNHDQSWHRASDNKDHCDIDLAIAGEHIALAAHAVGLASCWICNFDTALVGQALGLAPNEEPIALFPLGYADVERKDVERKPLDEILTII